MKYKVVKIKRDVLNIVKETPEQRKERVKNSKNHLVTKVVPDKKKQYNRQKFKRGEL